VQGDLRRPASLSRAVEGMDAVIHLAARATFEDMNSIRPTIGDGIPAALDDCVAFRWQHPVLDRDGW
jgi:hypothetical protein